MFSLLQSPWLAKLRRAVRPYRAGWRRQQADLASQYDAFLRGRGPAIQAELAAMPATRTALVVGYDSVKLATFQTPVLFGLRLAGYRVVVLAPSAIGATAAFYRAIGASSVVGTEDIAAAPPAASGMRPSSTFRSQQDVLDLCYEGIDVGRFVVSTLMRRLRVGSIDPSRPDVAAQLAPAISASKRAVEVARAVVSRYRPELVCFYDRGYTPEGELFEVALASGAQAITLNAAHRSGFVIAKRYSDHNRDRHFAAPSRAFWSGLLAMPWDDTKWQCLRGELEQSYRSGTWYDEVGTQFNKRIEGRDDVFRSLDLDSAKKVAVIFPHLFWDATFFWGDDLFDDYKDWFCQSIKVAATNDKLNWIVKIHPAGVVKDARDDFRGESSEMIAIRETLGSLPSHIKLIPPDSAISTYSLFGVMDYCLTVRGTIGIESAAFGASVITAGTGRYDGYGFTIDSRSREEYLRRLSTLETVPSASTEQIERARRYAYGLFIKRPLQFESVKFRYLQDSGASLEIALNLPEGVRLDSRADLTTLAAWFAASGQDDLVGHGIVAS